MVGQKIRRGAPAHEGAIDWRAAGRGLGTWAAFTLSVALYKPLGFTLSFALLTCFIVAVVFRRPLLVAVRHRGRHRGGVPPHLRGRARRRAADRLLGF